jgi:hypothetical protein
MHLGNYLGMVHRAELNLASAYREVIQRHGDEPDVDGICRKLARQCEEHAGRLKPFADRYGEDAPQEPERLHSDLFQGTRSGSLGLLRDLQDLYLMASEVDICWTIIRQAAQGVRDADLLAAVQACDSETAVQIQWLRTRMKQAAPQTLLVAS